MILGYNTNGFAHHDLSDVLEIIAEAGYRGVALTPDVHHLPFDESQPDAIEHYSLILEAMDLHCVVESGARFLLDSRRKHQPTLLSVIDEDRARRRELLEDHIDLANELGARCVSFWSGTPDSEEDFDDLMARLVHECRGLAEYAAKRKVRLAFEPEPGMFIDTMDKYAELYEAVNHPSFGLTLDLGHLICMNEKPASQHIHAWKHALWNIHLDDMKPGVHDHLMFGYGDVDFPDAFAALAAIDYRGLASVELSRHSYDAVNIARQAFDFLTRHAPPA